MKQFIEQKDYADALEHSMIDETTRKAWAHYAEHSEKPCRAANQHSGLAAATSKPLIEPVVDVS